MRKYFLMLLAALLFTCCTNHSGPMYDLLLQAEEMNRADQPFTSDSIGKALVRYYDRWYRFDANLKMRAYYMLGSAYRDMGEAPAAIHYYTVATEKADTLSQKCDYNTLFRIYGQMAMIYEQQNMPQEELEALESYCRYAQQAGDTLSYIVGMERKIVPYNYMGHTAWALNLTEEVRKMYIDRGLNMYAARSCPTAIYICIANKDYHRAQEYMRTYELESGLFDENGKIRLGQELYYDAKGQYYMGTGEIDSAEHYFRLLPSCGYPYEGFKGLLSVYLSKNETDSIAKYAMLHEQALLQWRKTRQAESVIQSSSMYRYERNQTRAEREAKNLTIVTYASLFALSLLITLAVMLWTLYRKAQWGKETKEREYRKLEEEYEEHVREYQKLTREYAILEKNLSSSIEKSGDMKQLLEEKQKNLEELERQLGWYESRDKLLDILRAEDRMKDEDIVKSLQKRSYPGKGWKRVSDKEWRLLIDVYKRYMPDTYNCIADFPPQERLTCILTHNGFPTGAIAVLLETSTPSITNSKRKASKRLTGIADAPNLLQSLRKISQGLNWV